MSWEIFRKNILQIALKPENVNNTDIIARAYAREYDLAVKRGYDNINKVPLQKGNVKAMEAFFKKALDNGLSYNEKYDLVGEMGKGVIAYWSKQPIPPNPNQPPPNPTQPPPGAVLMHYFPIPLVTIQQITSGVTANILVYSNIVTNAGKWIKPLAAINITNNQSTNNNRITGIGANATTADPIDTNTKEKILFVGDSLSAIKTETGIDITWTYPTSVRKSLPNATVDVLAIPAKQTSWMLQNLPSQLATTKYDRVYIWGGTNDMFSGVSFKAALGNIQKMVDLAISNGAKAYVIIGYDVKNMDWTRLKPTRYLTDITEYIPLIERYNEYQQQMPTTIQNAKFIGIFDLGPLTTDGIHPSAIQARQIANIIINAL